MLAWPGPRLPPRSWLLSCAIGFAHEHGVVRVGDRRPQLLFPPFQLLRHLHLVSSRRPRLARHAAGAMLAYLLRLRCLFRWRSASTTNDSSPPRGSPSSAQPSSLECLALGCST